MSDRDDVSEFGKLFSDIIRESLIQEANTPKVVNPVRYKALETVYDLFAEAFDGLPVKIAFEIEQIRGCGAITINLREIELDKQRAEKVSKALRYCKNLDMISRYSDAEISVTITSLLIDIQ